MQQRGLAAARRPANRDVIAGVIRSETSRTAVTGPAGIGNTRLTFVAATIRLAVGLLDRGLSTGTDSPDHLVSQRRGDRQRATMRIG